MSSSQNLLPHKALSLKIQATQTHHIFFQDLLPYIPVSPAQMSNWPNPVMHIFTQDFTVIYILKEKKKKKHNCMVQLCNCNRLKEYILFLKDTKKTGILETYRLY